MVILDCVRSRNCKLKMQRVTFAECLDVLVGWLVIRAIIIIFFRFAHDLTSFYRR